jgi:Lysozyme like domain
VGAGLAGLSAAFYLLHKDQSRAFAGGVPLLPNGMPDWSKIGTVEAEKGNINALSALAPLIQDQQWRRQSAPSTAWGGSSGAAPAGGGEGGTTGTYSLSQMIGMAQKAGFQGEDAARIASIAMAESGGDPGATGKAGEVGLTQINPNAWSFAASARDPQQAFNDAYQVFKKQGWGAWSTDPTSKNFTPGNSMARFLPRAEADLGKVGGASGTQFASLDDSLAYASPDKPAIPPVSASAGSTVPRADELTVPISGRQPQPATVPQQLAANNPDWAGINAALPTGAPPQVAGNIARAAGAAPDGTLTPDQAKRALALAMGYAQRNGPPQQQMAQGGQGQPSQAGPIIPQMQLPKGATDPMQAIQATGETISRGAAAQGSTVASIVSGTVSDPALAKRVAANVATFAGVDPNAPLTPDQADRIKKGVANYAARTGQPAPMAQQVATGGQGQPPQGGPVIPHIRLPWGLKDPQEAILRLDQEAARLASSPNPYDKAQIALLEDYRNRIAAQSEPVQIGNARFDGWTGKMILQGPSPVTARMEVMQAKADDIAEAIESGDQPPVLTGLYGMAPLVRSALEKNGFDLSKHQLQWDAAKKQVASLNGPQQVRFVGLANSVVNTINEVNDLAEQMQNSGVPLLNKARLTAYIQAEGNSENGQLAARYQTAVGTLKEEFANLANGGYAPAEPAWKLANDRVNGNYGVKELGASLTEIQRLIKYRLNAMPGMSQVGPGSANPYFPGGGQAPSAPAAGQGQPQGGGAHPPGNYNYDPATGNLEPVK